MSSIRGYHVVQRLWLDGTASYTLVQQSNNKGPGKSKFLQMLDDWIGTLVLVMIYKTLRITKLYHMIT
jgi:hypothetical protein